MNEKGDIKEFLNNEEAKKAGYGYELTSEEAKILQGIAQKNRGANLKTMRRGHIFTPRVDKKRNGEFTKKVKTESKSKKKMRKNSRKKNR